MVFRLVLLWVLALGQSACVLAAGMQVLSVPASGETPALELMVWTPCEQASQGVAVGPYLVRAVRDCPIEGQALPLVIVSHGQGGTLLGHHDTAVALADAGFVVASLNHPGDSHGDDTMSRQLEIFKTRPRDVSRTITFMLEEWRHRERLAPSAIGVFGFSRGGYTALALAGARPSTSAAAARFCSAWWSFALPLCRQLKDNASLAPRADPRVRAAVVVDPLSLFDADGLSHVHVPIQLWASELGGDGVKLAHVEAIRMATPGVREYRVVRGAGHFAFLAPCTATLREAAREICEDAPGFDRVEWHRSMNARVVDFLTHYLRSPARPGQ